MEKMVKVLPSFHASLTLNMSPIYCIYTEVQRVK